MNVQKEQEHLIEFLEEALAEAKLQAPLDRQHVDEIENELQEVLKEYKRQFESDEAQPFISKDSTDSIQGARASPSVSFLLQREGWLGSFLSNLRTLLFQRQCKGQSHQILEDLKECRRPGETALQQGGKIIDVSVGRLPSRNFSRFSDISSPEQTLFDTSFGWLQRVWSNVMAVCRSAPTVAGGPKAVTPGEVFRFNEISWWETFFSNLKVLLASRRRGELAKPADLVVPPKVFDNYRIHSSSFLISMILHVLTVASILLIPLFIFQDAPRVKLLVTDIRLQFPTYELKKTPLHLPPVADKAGGGGGGGRRESTPASLGRLPRASDRQLTPPVPKIVNENPVLPVEPTVVAPPLAQLPTVNLPYYGDPFGVPGPPSSGPGTGGGIGTGRGGGVGPGVGEGVGPGEGGGYGGGVYRVGGGVSAPVVIFRVEPQYSEEARKAKYQGTVIISAIVRKDGGLDILKIVRGIGLGLDENAVEALRQWKFRPGMKNGLPVDVYLNVEVNYSLR